MEYEAEGAMAKDKKPVRSESRARLHRSFQHLSNALKKKLHGRGHANMNDKSTSSSSSTSFLSGCMHPRTHSFASSRRRRHHHNGDASASGRKRNVDEDEDDDALALDFRSLQLGTTGATGADESGSTTSTQGYYTDGGGREGDQGDGVPVSAEVAGGVAVVTFSAAPYEDFRRSMREMVDAARREAEPAAAAVDWDLMEELLFCYLELNDRAVHKDILRAFTDTVAALRRRRRRRAAGAANKSGRARLQRRRRATEHGRDGAEAEAVASS